MCSAVAIRSTEGCDVERRNDWFSHPLIVGVVTVVVSILGSIGIAQCQINSSERGVRDSIAASDRSVRAALAAQNRAQRRDFAEGRNAERRQGRRAGYQSFQAAASRFVAVLGTRDTGELRREDTSVTIALERLELDASERARDQANVVAGSVRRAFNESAGAPDGQISTGTFRDLQDALRRFSNRVALEIR